MSKGIVKKRCSGYSLRGLGALIIPRFNTRYMKDSVEYRGSVLWNFVHYNEQGVEHHQLKYLKEQLRLSSYFIDFKDAVQSVCKQRLCLHFGIQNIEFYSTTIYIFMILEYNK
jgi:hypothetical protein